MLKLPRNTVTSSRSFGLLNHPFLQVVCSLGVTKCPPPLNMNATNISAPSQKCEHEFHICTETCIQSFRRSQRFIVNWSRYTHVDQYEYTSRHTQTSCGGTVTRNTTTNNRYFPLGTIVTSHQGQSLLPIRDNRYFPLGIIVTSHEG